MWLSVPASAGSAKLQTRQCAVSRQQYLTLQSPCKKCLLKTTRIPTALGTCQCRAADTINGLTQDAREHCWWFHAIQRPTGAVDGFIKGCHCTIDCFIKGCQEGTKNTSHCHSDCFSLTLVCTLKEFGAWLSFASELPDQCGFYSELMLLMTQLVSTWSHWKKKYFVMWQLIFVDSVWIPCGTYHDDFSCTWFSHIDRQVNFIYQAITIRALTEISVLLPLLPKF